jgi:hypothetical protein
VTTTTDQCWTTAAFLIEEEFSMAMTNEALVERGTA